jgi:hypothetical protein
MKVLRQGGGGESRIRVLSLIRKRFYKLVLRFGFRLQHAHKQACCRLSTFFRHRVVEFRVSIPTLAVSAPCFSMGELRRLERTP